MKYATNVKSMALVLIAAMIALIAVACEGDVGPQGARGAAGPAGAAGSAGPAGPQTGTSIMLDSLKYRAATDKDNNVVFTIYGAGFLPNEGVEIVVLSPTGAPSIMPSATASSGGAFVHTTSPQFTMTAPGHYAISATGFVSGNSASASIVVTE